jgi:hypothetical protein
MRSYKPITLLILLISASLACSILQPSASPDQGSIETQVAATFTAIAPDQPSATIAATTTESAASTDVSSTPTEIPENTPQPVGLRVVYVKNGVIYLWEEGQSPTPLTGSGSPIYSLDLSDDGQLIAFTRQVGEIQAELWVVNIDGSNERVLVSEQDFKFYDPNALAVVPYLFSWKPGTRQLAYNTNQVFEGPRPGQYNDLRLIDADTMAQTTLLEPGQGGDFYFSPDGSQIAISTPNSISLVDANGGNLRPAVLEYEPVLTYSEYQYYAQPRWLNDSSGLKVIIPPVDSLSDPRPPSTLWKIPLDGSPAIKTGEIVTMPFFANSTAFSPDLEKIAYLIETGDPPQNIHELHFVNPVGSEDMAYHAERLLNFAGWAQDSLHFAITSGENQALQIGQIDAPYNPVADPPTSVFKLIWVDSERYLYIQDPGGEATLYLAGLSNPPFAIDQVADAYIPFDFMP